MSCAGSGVGLNDPCGSFATQDVLKFHQIVWNFQTRENEQSQMSNLLRAPTETQVTNSGPSVISGNNKPGFYLDLNQLCRVASGPAHPLDPVEKWQEKRSWCSRSSRVPAGSWGQTWACHRASRWPRASWLQTETWNEWNR